VPFYPARVTSTGVPDSILLKMNARATETGAFNTQRYETFSRNERTLLRQHGIDPHDEST
jgi:hypothetical protein